MGANSPVIGLVLNLFIGIALGVNVVIVTASGRGDAETVRRTVHTAVTMSALCGALLLAGERLMAVFNSDPEVIAVGCMRLRIVFAALLYYHPSRRFADREHN